MAHWDCSTDCGDLKKPQNSFKLHHGVSKVPIYTREGTKWSTHTHSRTFSPSVKEMSYFLAEYSEMPEGVFPYKNAFLKGNISKLFWNHHTVLFHSSDAVVRHAYNQCIPSVLAVWQI